MNNLSLTNSQIDLLTKALASYEDAKNRKNRARQAVIDRLSRLIHEDKVNVEISKSIQLPDLI